MLGVMLRILAGQFRSRRLKTPRNNKTRPWIGRSKENVFNHLRGHIEGGVVLDLFAGVGTMGLEAVSRGAKLVVFIEQDRRIFMILEENIAMMDCKDRAIAVHSDALSTVPLLRVPRPVDVVFVDPPYAMMRDETMRARLLDQIMQVAQLLDQEGFIILRTPLDPKVVDHTIDTLEGPEVHREGLGMWVLYYWTLDQ